MDKAKHVLPGPPVVERQHIRPSLLESLNSCELHEVQNSWLTLAPVLKQLELHIEKATDAMGDPELSRKVILDVVKGTINERFASLKADIRPYVLKQLKKTGAADLPKHVDNSFDTSTAYSYRLPGQTNKLFSVEVKRADDGGWWLSCDSTFDSQPELRSWKIDIAQGEDLQALMHEVSKSFRLPK